MPHVWSAVSELCSHFPLLQSRLGLAYRPHSFWINMLDAFYQSLVIFFVAEAAYSDSDIDMWEFGTTITTSCLITMLLHGAIEIKSWVGSVRFGSGRRTWKQAHSSSILIYGQFPLVADDSPRSVHCIQLGIVLRICYYI